MTDTLPAVAERARLQHAQMTGEARIRIASELFDTAVAIVESSLPAKLPRRERRLALARRLYGDELPDAAYELFADYGGGQR